MGLYIHNTHYVSFSRHYSNAMFIRIVKGALVCVKTCLIIIVNDENILEMVHPIDIHKQ